MSITEERRQERMSGVGGSDVAVVVGISPFKTEAELYYEKRGEIEPEDISSKEVVHFGNVLEDVVADEFARRNDLKVRRRNQLFKHKKHPCLIANIDRSVDGKQMILECKTSNAFMQKEWGETDSDDMPDYYRVQVEHYMNVLGYNDACLAVLIGGNQYRQYWVQRDPELSEMLTEQCLKFWERVEKGNPPDMDPEHRSTAGLIKKLHPGTDGSEIILPESITHWHEVKKEAELEIKTCEIIVRKAKNKIAEAMGDASTGVLATGDYQYKRTLQKRKEFTTPASEFYVTRGSAKRK